MIQAEWKFHPEVQEIEEEWSGVTNRILRRKLQNRLNQRAARRRKTAQTTTSTSDAPEIHRRVQRAGSTLASDNELIAILIAKAHSASKLLQLPEGGMSLTPLQSLRTRIPRKPPLAMLLDDRAGDIKSFCAQVIEEWDSRLLYPLPADQLLTLVYYNVYRALVQNIAILGLDQDLMCTDEYPSPFLPLSPSATSALVNLPPALQPTELQKAIAHHPEFDIIPFANVRDNLLQARTETFNDVELCLDVVGDGTGGGGLDYDTQKEAGMIVWGEPWDPEVWEVTEKFISKWRWMLKGALELERSTNKYRKQRGQKEVYFAHDEGYTV